MAVLAGAATIAPHEWLAPGPRWTLTEVLLGCFGVLSLLWIAQYWSILWLARMQPSDRASDAAAA